MTEISADLLKELADAIYGGPAVSRRGLTALLADWALETPLDVVAVDWPAGRAWRGGRGGAAVRVLRLHPGIAYVLASQDGMAQALRTLARDGALVGEAYRCESVDRLVWAIQQSVLSLRRRQLGPDQPELSQVAEVQARALALHRLRTGHADAQQAVDAWIGIVLSRHQQHVNTVRRKLVEALCLLTMESDASRLGFPFIAGVTRMMETFNLPATGDVFRATVAELLPLVRDGSAESRAGLVGEAQRFIADRFKENIGLAQVARHLGCAPTHLSRAFRQRTGQTLTAYLQSHRVAAAKAMLLETDSPLRVIAPAAGFQSVKHFHRIFLRQTGLTPQQFRAS